jgi:hypothetical protein
MDTTIRCHMCGAADLARVTACKRCGARLAAEESPYGAGGSAYGARTYPPPPRPASAKKKDCPVCFHACAPSADSCPACGHRFPGLRARYVVVPLSFLVVLLLFAAMRYFDEKAKETHIRNLESGIARQYGIVDTTVHPTRQKPWFWSLFRGKPTVSEIFAHNLEVSGGAEAVGRIKSHRSKGTLNFSTFDNAFGYRPGGQTQTPPAKVVMHAKAPNKIETEYEMYVSTREGSGTRVVRRGFDGERGWEYVETNLTQYDGARPVTQSELREFTGAELEQIKHYASATGLVRLADEYGSLVLLPNRKISTMEFYGAKEFERECYVVRGLSADKKFETFYFDIDTGLLTRFDFEAQGPDGPTIIECYPDTYKEVDKVMLPFRLTFKLDSLRATILFDEYKLNEPIPDSTFAQPSS